MPRSRENVELRVKAFGQCGIQKIIQTIIRQPEALFHIICELVMTIESYINARTGRSFNHHHELGNKSKIEEVGYYEVPPVKRSQVIIE